MLDKDCCHWDRVKYAAYTRFKEPKLYRLAVSGDWDEIPQRAKSHPKEAQFKHSYAPMDMALHRLLRAPLKISDDEKTQNNIKKIRFEAVEALLNANADACRDKDTFGRTPLHLASMDVTECQSPYIILMAHPQAAAVTDLDGRTPLHYLLARNDQVPPCILRHLIDAYPEALTIKDSTNETPMDVIHYRSCEIENAEKILDVLNIKASQIELETSFVSAASTTSESTIRTQAEDTPN